MVDVYVRNILGKRLKVYGKVFRYQRTPYEYEVEVIKPNFYRLRIGSYEYYIDWKEGKLLVNKGDKSSTITRKGQNNQLVKLLKKYFNKVYEINNSMDINKVINSNDNNGKDIGINNNTNIKPALKDFKNLFDTLFIITPILISFYITNLQNNNPTSKPITINFHPKSKNYLNIRKKILKHINKLIPKNNKYTAKKFFPIYKIIEIKNLELKS